MTYFKCFLYVSVMFLVCSLEGNAAYWVHFTSEKGDIPILNSGGQQTASLVLDVDRNGTKDFLIAE